MAKYTFRPSRAVSALTGGLGLFLSLFGVALFVGLFFAFGSEPLMLIPLAFVGVWLLFCLSITGYHLYNAFTGKAPPIGVVQREDSEGEDKP